MKILHVITALNVGGAEAMLARLLEHERSCSSSHRSSVASLMPPGQAGMRIRESGVALYDCGVERASSALAGLARLRRIIDEVRPDMIMGWMYHAHVATALAGMLHRVPNPTIWNVRHSIDDLRQEKPSLRMVIQLGALLSRSARTIIYNSHAAAEQHGRLGFRAKRAVVIPNGFDCDRLRPRTGARDEIAARLGIDSRALIIGMAARNHPMKDAATLAIAVRRARDAGVDAHLLLTGEGMDKPTGRLARLVGELPADRVTLRGHDASLAELLPGLDLLALPSAWGEGFPNILGEAMACGVPCIATDVGDSRWVVADTGLIVPPRDPEQMAGAILSMAQLGAIGRRRLGEAARERVKQRFSIGQIAALYRELYEEAVSGTAPAPGTQAELYKPQVM
ncbi:glycosyltransferase [Sphingobium bisphenolivorans]|uniref:glycosyltransferase n=1 Tax=Sphingobium bisphenolivorans TaxID=1335760 RepID=UPI0003B6F0CE|nr:glycosyltransferase [Sphingobium bisphenolivorans]